MIEAEQARNAMAPDAEREGGDERENMEFGQWKRCVVKKWPTRAGIAESTELRRSLTCEISICSSWRMT
jgi:hypothetical protein